ncbi:hypothetical protein BgiMline_035549, partial [Biomphalaria glabrata]
DATCLIFGIIWFLILIFLAWPVSCFIAGLYILLQPFAVCIDPIKEINAFLFKLLTLPTTVTEKMMNGSGFG